VLAYTFGPRTDETCRELLGLLTPFHIGMITSDDWGSYGREVPKEKHLTGKIFTQRIERNNLALRTRIKRLARKTICFSRSVELHEKVIGAFIENTSSTNWKHHQWAEEHGVMLEFIRPGKPTQNAIIVRFNRTELLSSHTGALTVMARSE